MVKKPVHYINNTDLLAAVVKWQAACKIAAKAGQENPIIPDYIGRCIMEINQRLSTRYNFNNYTYRDEMVSDGIEACVNAVAKFNIEKTDRVFNYFTMVAFNAFRRRILSERKQQYIKHKNYQHRYMMLENDGGEDQITNNDLSNRVIGEYEEKMLTKANKSDKVKATSNIFMKKSKTNGQK